LIQLSKNSLKYLLTNFSEIFANALVTEIGRISVLTCTGGKSFGRGVILDIFYWSGTIPCRSDELIIAATGGAKQFANSLRIL